MVATLQTFSIIVLLNVLYQHSQASVVHLSMVTHVNPCTPMGDPKRFNDESENMDAEKLPFRVRLFVSEDNTAQTVNILGIFRQVLIQARSKSFHTAPLVGTWSGHDLPKGEKALNCEGKNSSSISSDTNLSLKKFATYTWKGTCSQDISFFVYVSTTNEEWHHMKIPCAKPTSTFSLRSKSDRFTQWTSFGSCSKTCGTSQQFRFRKCTLTSGCGSGATKEARDCSLLACERFACKDRNFRCSVWGTMGYCHGNLGAWVKQRCPATCQVCSLADASASSSCIDSPVYPFSCTRWSSKNFCSKGYWVKFVRKNCRQSCGIC